ncbi:MAG: sensor domain-containing protein [Thermoplasmatota archaeon]
MSELRSIKDYRNALERELKGEDPALIVDAQDDAEEFLEEMTSDLISSGKCKDRKTAVRKAIRQYGSPGSVAREYLRSDEEQNTRERIGKRTKKKEKVESKSILYRTFSVYWDYRTYLNLLYLLLMFPIGIIYFTYIVAGISTGFGLIITIIGIPLLILFLVSIYGLSWLHGRMTELMLGIRMPKKKRKLVLTGSAWNRLKIILKDPRLYSSLIYMLLMFPLGIIYFVILVSLLSTSFSLICLPFYVVYKYATVSHGGLPGPDWFVFVTTVFGSVFGVLFLTWTLHLSNITAWAQGHLSKLLLLKR